MAVRDRNLFAWQAYVITMTIVSFGLLLSLGYVLFSSGTTSKMAESAAEREKKASNDLRTANFKLQYLQYVLGAKQLSDADVQTLLGTVATDAEIQPIKTKFDKDMGLLGPQSQDKNYSALVVDLMKAIRERNMEIDKYKKENEKLVADVDVIRKQETKARMEAEAAREKIEKQLTAAREDYRNKELDLQKTVDQLTSEKDAFASKSRKETETLRNEISKREGEIAALKLEKKQAVENNIAKYQREDFESAQGKVLSVDQGGVIVMVNLGRKDGIREGLRFSVLPENTIRVSEGTLSCQIEITRVFETTSQARVIPNRLNVPAIPNDLVYSPFWNAGERVEYALVGKMDMNGDGLDDREQVKALIEATGGVVVEDVGPDAKPSKGKITFNTRYLVVGQMPVGIEKASEDGRIADTSKRYRDIQTRARDLSLTEMPLQKLVGYLRKYDDDRVIGLGDATRSDDFRERKGPQRSSFEGLSRDPGLKNLDSSKGGSGR